MKIILMTVGKTTTPALRAGIEEYATRVCRFIPFEIIEIPDVKTSRKLTPQLQKQAEGEAILTRLQTSDHVVLLDERGKEPTSREFAESLSHKEHTVSQRLVFIVGGPYGFSPDVYTRANEKMSLSRMTFPHEMVRLFFTEQLYRAYSILHNLPYHHD